MGEGRHVSFTLAAGGARSRCVAFGRGSALPAAPGEPVDAAVRLEVNRYNGAVEPRLVLRRAQPARPAPIEMVGEPEDALARRSRAELDAAAREPRRRRLRGRRRARPRERAAARRARRRHRRTAGRPRRGRRAGARRHRPRRAPRAPRCATASAASRVASGRRSRATRRSRRATRTSSPSTRPRTPHRARSPDAAGRRAGPTWRGAAPSWSSPARVLPGSSTCAPRSPATARSARPREAGGATRARRCAAMPARQTAPSRGPARSPGGCCACSPSSGSSCSRPTPLAVRAAGSRPHRARALARLPGLCGAPGEGLASSAQPAPRSSPRPAAVAA